MKKIIQVVIAKIKTSKEAMNASWIITGRLIQMGIAFFISVITTRYLGPSNYGIINYATAYVTFFTSLCTLGLDTIIVKEFVNNKEQEGEIIGSSLLMRMIASILSIVAILGVVCIVDAGELTTIIVCGLCSLGLFFQIFNTFDYWFQAQYKSKVSAIAGLIAYILTSIYKVLLLVQKKDVTWFAFSTSIDYICIAIILYFAYKKSNGPKIKVCWDWCKKLLLQSYHYILSNMMVAIYMQTDKFMLKQMLDETSVGYYSLASSLNLIWVFILSAIIDSMFPSIFRYFETNHEKYIKTNKRLYAMIIYISLFVSVFFCVFGELIIGILYGKEYLPAAMPLRIVTWYTIFAYLGVARNAWVICEKKQKYLKYMYMAAAFSNIVLNIILIPLWGPSGAAFASLITQILTCMILPCFIKDMRPNVRLMFDAFLLRGIK